MTYSFKDDQMEEIRNKFKGNEITEDEFAKLETKSENHVSYLITCSVENCSNIARFERKTRDGADRDFYRCIELHRPFSGDFNFCAKGFLIDSKGNVVFNLDWTADSLS